MIYKFPADLRPFRKGSSAADRRAGLGACQGKNSWPDAENMAIMVPCPRPATA